MMKLVMLSPVNDIDAGTNGIKFLKKSSFSLFVFQLINAMMQLIMLSVLQDTDMSSIGSK